MDELGVRRQSEAATALSGGRETSGMRKVSGRAKAGSRCACPRSPRPAGALTDAPPNRAQRLGVRQPAGALDGRAGENGHRAGAGEGRAGNPLPAAACQPMRSGSPRRRARSDAPDHGGRLVAGDQDLAEGSLGWTNGAKGVVRNIPTGFHHSARR